MTSPAATLTQLLHSNTFQARDVHIQTNVHQMSTTPARRDPMEILQEYVAFGALHDSAERFDPPKCHPETRTAILGLIDQWVHDVSDSAKPILWLNGAAGGGKSAIVQTMVEKWKEAGLFSANFFFWRTGDQRNHKTHLVATLAFQIAAQYPSLKPNIERAVIESALFHRSLWAQMEALLVLPSAGLPADKSPLVLVIDGLDECCLDLPNLGCCKDLPHQKYEDQQKEILEAVARVCRKANPGCVKFLIASRPEHQIRESLGEGDLKKYTSPLFLNSAADAKADIRLFVGWRFEEIRQRHHIDPSWPSEDQITELVEKSSGQFIYPSIAMKYISRARANPVESLKAVLELQPGSTDKPLAELDRLYTIILNAVAAGSRSVVSNVLRTIIGGNSKYLANAFDLSHRAHAASPRFFEQFLFLKQGEVYFHLTDLHSVLDISSSPEEPITVIHATFSEYLQNESRSDGYFISNDSIYGYAALFSLRHIEECLQHKNIYQYHPLLISNLSYPWLPRSPPSKDLMHILWGMMEADIGACPSSYTGRKFLSSKHEEHSTATVAHSRTTCLRGLIEKLNNDHKETILEPIDANETTIRFINYLQRCNIPDIEPSWWRRYVICRRLEIAEFRLERGGNIKPVSNFDIALDDIRVLAIWLTCWLEPTGFRLKFAQTRPSPSPRSSVTEAGRQSERSNPLTEFEKVSASATVPAPLKNGIKTPTSPTVLAAVNYVSTPANPVEPGPPSSGLTEEERQFAAEEAIQWSGELQRMDTFATFLESITTTFSQNDEERRHKFQALLDEQEAEYSARNKGRQESFTKDVNGFQAVAKENQSKWDISVTFYEAARENLMRTGREMRINVKEAAEKELSENAEKIQKEEQESFDEEVRKMDVVVCDLVEQAKQETERLLLTLAKAKVDSPPGEVSDQQFTLSGTATCQTLPNAEPESYFPAPVLVARSVSSHSRSRSRSPGTPPPTTVVIPPPFIQRPPTIIEGPRSRSPSCSRSRSHSPGPYRFDDGELQEEPVQIPTPVPCPASSQDRVEDPVILNLTQQRQADWERDEQARDQGEEQRRELFTSALGKIHVNHTSTLENLLRLSGDYDVRRAKAETRREEEFEALLRTNRCGLDLFKASVEKKLAVLNVLEDEYDERLKADIRAVGEREEKELARGRKRLSKKFEKLQVERRDKLMKAFDELKQARDTIRTTHSSGATVSSPNSAQKTYPRVRGLPSCAMPGVPAVDIPPSMQMPTSIQPQVILNHSLSGSSSSRSRSRSRSPAVGFAPQALFKMRNVSTLPTPRPSVQTSAPENHNSIPSAQLSERARVLTEGLSKRAFIFAVNETNRQIFFEQAQVERQNLFNSIEYEQDSTFKNRLQEQKQRFLEGDQQLESTFIRKRGSRNERFVEEQRKMGKEYNDLEERLVRECSCRERERLEGLKLWMVRFVTDKRVQWEEGVRREMKERKERFREMTMGRFVMDKREQWEEGVQTEMKEIQVMTLDDFLKGVLSEMLPRD